MAGIPNTARPGKDEYDSFYETYVGLVPETDIEAVLTRQLEEFASLLSGLSEADGDLRYAPGKWQLREVLGHVVDAEWIFSGRAFWFARGDRSAQPGMEQDDFAAAATYAHQSLATIQEQFVAIRRAGLSQFRTFSGDALSRRGVASGSEVSVRALLYIVAGHFRHHLRVIDDRYLGRTS